VSHYNIRGKVKSTEKSCFAQNNKGGHPFLAGLQNVAMAFDGMETAGLVEMIQRAAPVCVIPIDVPLFVAASGCVIISVRVLKGRGVTCQTAAK
jgi:hypothetical protein